MLRKILVDHCSAHAFRHTPALGNAFDTSHSHRGVLQAWRHSLCFALITLVAASLNAATGKLEVRFFDVGQGDAILVTCPEGKHHLLIDSGDTRYPNSSKNFRALLSDAFKNQPQVIDVAVASHVHTDHIGSMQWVLENFRVANYIDNGDTSEKTTYGNLR